jgi:ribosome-binding factor A
MRTNPRAQRVADQIQIELSNLIRRRLKDPRTGFITLTAVEVSRDLRQARIFISALDDEELAASMETLERAKGFLRSELGQRIRVRHLPELHFQADDSAMRGRRVQELLRELRDRGELGDEDSE